MSIQKNSWKDIDTTGMVLTNWIKVDNQLIRQIIAGTNAQTAMLYLIILSHRNVKSDQCFTSISLLAKEMNLSDRTIQRMINELCDLDVLIVNSGKQGVANNYYFPKEAFFKDDVFAYKKKTGFRKKPVAQPSIMEELGLTKDDPADTEDSIWDAAFDY